MNDAHQIGPAVLISAYILVLYDVSGCIKGFMAFFIPFDCASITCQFDLLSHTDALYLKPDLKLADTFFCSPVFVLAQDRNKQPPQ